MRIVWGRLPVGAARLRKEDGRLCQERRPLCSEWCRIRVRRRVWDFWDRTCNLDFFGEADFAEQPDAVVVDVELIPGEAVTRADGMGVVVVVPAFAAGEQSDPPVVAGVVLGLEAALAPEVRRRVDEPGGVEANGDA